MSYWKSSTKSAKKNWPGLLLNLLGFGLSLAALILISLFVKRELSYDTHHEDYQRIFRLTEDINSGTYIEQSASCPYPVGEALLNEFPQDLESVVRIFDFQIPEKSIKLETNELFIEKGIYYVDSSFFQVFNFEIVQGSKHSPLKKAFQMLISDKLVEKYFKNQNPVGKSIRLGGQDELNCEIVGVFKARGPSHIEANALVSISTAEKIAPFIKQNWVWNPCWTYVKLKPGVEASTFKAKLPAFVDKHYPEVIKHMVSHDVQAVNNIHLNSHREFEMSGNSDMQFVYIFISCAILLLIIASINFVNLNSVYFLSRIREFGVRQVLGASKNQIRLYLIGESIFIALTSFFMAIFFVYLSYPIIASFVNLPLDLKDLIDVQFLLWLLIGVLVISAIAGLSPSLLLERIQIPSIFKSGVPFSPKLDSLRKLLVVFQFGLSFALIVFTTTAYRQFNFLQSKNNGMKDESMIVLKVATTVIQGKFDAFKEALLKLPEIESVSRSNEILGVKNNNHEFRTENMPQGEWKYFPALMVDEDILNCASIRLLAGRNFSDTYASEDSLAIIVNESMSRFLGFADPQEAIGYRFQSMSGKERIVGVVEDFNFKSLHHEIGPFVFDIPSRKHKHDIHFGKYALIKSSDLSAETLMKMEAVWLDFVKTAPFDPKLLNSELQSLYIAEKRLSRVLLLFSVLSIIIACMGMFALSWFSMKKKTKELALRKVLGSNQISLFMVAIRSQMFLVLIAVILGSLLSIYGIDKWLQNFPYRTEMAFWNYFSVALIVLSMAFLTIMWHAIRISFKNPIDSLRYE